MIGCLTETTKCVVAKPLVNIKAKKTCCDVDAMQYATVHFNDVKGTFF